MKWYMTNPLKKKKDWGNYTSCRANDQCNNLVFEHISPAGVVGESGRFHCVIIFPLLPDVQWPLFFLPFPTMDRRLSFLFLNAQGRRLINGGGLVYEGESFWVGGSFSSPMVPPAMSIDPLLLSNQCRLDVCFSQQSLNQPPHPTPTEELDLRPGHTAAPSRT